jgi:hypothetical protein
MSLDRIYLRGEWAQEIVRLYPRITIQQIEAFAALVKTDRLVDDEGNPTEEFKTWCLTIK